jgi:hypothetical protein
MSTPNPMRTALVVAAALVAAVPAHAVSIPAWLDQAITSWNGAHPESQIRFVNVKDSFVWYDMPRTPELGHAQIRDRVGGIVEEHGYAPMDDEEMVTMAAPPVTSGRTSQKKCWSRSFVLNVEAQANTKAVGEDSPGLRQRVLTSLVCEDTATWWAAFRVAE